MTTSHICPECGNVLVHGPRIITSEGLLESGVSADLANDATLLDALNALAEDYETVTCSACGWSDVREVSVKTLPLEHDPVAKRLGFV